MKDQFDHIEEYLKGELSEEEQASFESMMEGNPEIKEKVEMQRQLLKGIELGFNQELKQLLIEEESRLPGLKKNQSNRVKSLYPVIGIAATVSLMIIAFYTFRNTTTDTSELYAQYYQPYPNVEAPISRSDINASNPFALYENRDYEKAMEKFKALRSTQPDEPSIIFYSAICQLELGSTTQAISSLRELLELHENKYSRPALWYLSLAYLKSDQTREAISQLNDLTSIDDVYAKKAADLLHQLDKK